MSKASHFEAIIYIKSMEKNLVDIEFYQNQEPFKLYKKIQVDGSNFGAGTMAEYLGDQALNTCYATFFNPFENKEPLKIFKI